jgi:hypothetical protein
VIFFFRETFRETSPKRGVTASRTFRDKEGGKPLSPTRIDHTDKEGVPSVCLRLCLFGSLCVSVLRLCEFIDTPIGLKLLVYEALNY